MVKGIGITVIVDEIKNEEEILFIKEGLVSVFPKEALCLSTERYTKFCHAYKIEFMVPLTEISERKKIIYDMLSLSESIAGPWLIYFDKDGENTELIFNREVNTHVARPDFYPIRWAHIQLIY